MKEERQEANVRGVIMWKGEKMGKGYIGRKEEGRSGVGGEGVKRQSRLQQREDKRMKTTNLSLICV